MKKKIQNSKISEANKETNQQMEEDKKREDEDKKTITKEKKEKKKIKRINLDENNLLFGQNGIRKLYDIIIKSDFNSSREVRN